ncbi:36329_t:CDS:2 [Gigaspora margarita]|uniref:36329_t:CDS:1 n=1 Tax=Gigaspora margarita TaxID=4874 RepID=A0ABM8VVP7_GIGMA|nr:36329_t:CDS:2 [Gigaspora margarita]
MEKISLGIETASNTLSITSTLVRGAANVADVIALFVPLVNNITDAVKEILNLCETVEYNKRICGTLLERVLFAEAATKALMSRADYFEDKLNSTEFYKKFQKFTDVIEKIKIFVKEVSQITGLRKFFQASEIKSRFITLLEEFDSLMNLLQFSMVVRSSDISHVILKDLEELKHYMERIEGGLTKRIANETIFNPNLEDIAIMNIAWQNGTFPLNNNLFSSVMINPNLIIDNQNGRKSKEIVQAFYKNPTSGIESVALKLLTNSNATKGEKKKNIKSEILIFKRLKDCKHIIEFYGLVERDTGIYLVTQWANNGNLKKFYMEKNDVITFWNIKVNIALDIARALTFLHSVSIYHHDLRSENVLITDRYTAKLANFTRSRCFSADTNPMERTLEKMRYIAPEKLENESQSFGRLLWEIAECKEPFGECQDILKLKKLVLNKNTTLDFSFEIPKEWQEITNKAMQYNANLRPALSEIFNILFEISLKYNADVCENIDDIPISSSTIIHNPNDLYETTCDDFSDLDIIDNHISLKNVLSAQDALIEHKKSNGNKKDAFESFKVHAEHGNITAMYWYGYYLDKENNPFNSEETIEEKQYRFQKAAALFKETADEGLTDGQLRYGYCLWYGEKYLRHAALLNEEKALKMCKKERILLA